MSEPTLIDRILGFGKKLIVIDERFTRQETAIKELDEKISALRTDLSALTTKVEVLRESHNTVDERSKRVVAEAVSELRVKYAEVVADLRVKVIEAELERRPHPSEQVSPSEIGRGEG